MFWRHLSIAHHTGVVPSTNGNIITTHCTCIAERVSTWLSKCNKVFSLPIRRRVLPFASNLVQVWTCVMKWLYFCFLKLACTWDSFNTSAWTINDHWYWVQTLQMTTRRFTLLLWQSEEKVPKSSNGEQPLQVTEVYIMNSKPAYGSLSFLYIRHTIKSGGWGINPLSATGD